MAPKRRIRRLSLLTLPATLDTSHLLLFLGDDFLRAAEPEHPEYEEEERAREGDDPIHPE